MTLRLEGPVLGLEIVAAVGELDAIIVGVPCDRVTDVVNGADGVAGTAAEGAGCCSPDEVFADGGVVTVAGFGGAAGVSAGLTGVGCGVGGDLSLSVVRETGEGVSSSLQARQLG